MSADTKLDPLSVSWRWCSFGGELMLVTDGSGCKVIIAGNTATPKGRGRIDTRDGTTGLLRAIAPDDAVARAIEAVPEMIAALEKLAERTIEYVGERPNPDPELAAALDCDEEMRALALAGLALLERVRS